VIRVLYLAGGILILGLAWYIGDRLYRQESPLLLILVAPVLLVSLVLGGVLVYGTLRPPKPADPEPPIAEEGE
jgi:hypothetical protein